MLITDCVDDIHDGFDTTYVHERSLSNPDRLITDCVENIHVGRDTKSVHAKFILNLVSGMDY
jgi:hypothetical protein